MRKGKAMSSLVDHAKDLSLDSKSNGRPHKGFKQAGCIVKFEF